MHSSRMCTARSLTVSHRALHMPPLQTHMPPRQPHMLPRHHTCPPATMHTSGNYAPPATMHTPHNHACSPATMHAPPVDRITDACENITLP